jgi:hypothetical protein
LNGELFKLMVFGVFHHDWIINFSEDGGGAKAKLQTQPVRVLSDVPLTNRVVVDDFTAGKASFLLFALFVEVVQSAEPRDFKENLLSES